MKTAAVIRQPLCVLSIYFYYVQYNFDCLVHFLYGAALVVAMVIDAAGAEVRAGETVVGQAGTVGATADGHVYGGKAGFL